MNQELAYRIKDAFDLYPNDFDSTFRTWLRENLPIYEAFHKKADSMAQYRQHYSARTVIENIRWDTDLSSNDALFKINNNITPDMARMYNRITESNFFAERRKYGVDRGEAA